MKTVVSQTAQSNARRVKQERQNRVLDDDDDHQSSYFNRSENCKLEKIQNFADVSYELNESCPVEPLPNGSEDEGSFPCVLRETDGDFGFGAAAESTSKRLFENTVCKNTGRSLSTGGKRYDDDTISTQNEEMFADSSIAEPSREFDPAGRKSSAEDGAGGRAKRRRRSRKKSRLGRPSVRERINGKYLCTFPGCCEKYASLEHVTDHELQHTVPDGHFFSCAHCTERFKWRHYLRIHVKSNHVGEAAAPTKPRSFH